LNRRFALFAGNIGKGIPERLIRDINDAICGELPPVFNPGLTKRAVTIEDN
jgi:hypothetical protein